MNQQLILFDFDETIVSGDNEEHVIKDVLEDFKTYSQYPNNDVVVLTARYRRVPVIEFFKKLGIENIDVVAVGELNPVAKSSFVMNKLSQKNYRAVRVYEDKMENISAISNVVTSLGIPFSYKHVQKHDASADVRDFIDLTLSKEADVPKSKGAGIVVVRKFDKEWKVLALVLDGKYDLPKGKMEEGETEFQTALRETEEESGINSLDFDWGEQSTSIKHLTFFIAKTSQDAHIPMNPESGIYEHDDAEWISFKEIRSNLYDYLLPIIDWSESLVII
jgi:bis(5'-nucleosidyl)-tetraphosphatase